MLVDDDIDQQAEADGDVRHPMFRRRARAAECHHVRGPGARAGRGSGYHDAPAVGVENSRPQLGAADYGREAKLIAACHEDTGRVLEGVDGSWIVGLLTGFGTQAGDFGDPDPTKDMAVEVGRRIAERGRGADHHNVSLVTAGELNEA